MRVLVRVATAESEKELVELARTATAAQLTTIIRASMAAMRDPARQDELRELTFGWDEDGMGTVRAVLSARAHD